MQRSSFVPEPAALPRGRAAFSFQFAAGDLQRSCSAWMLTLTAGGGEFLVSSAEAPRPGSRIRLSDLPSSIVLLRLSLPAMPDEAVVDRVECPDSHTRRVLFRFDVPAAIAAVEPAEGEPALAH